MLLCSSDKHCRTFLCSTGIGLATACLGELLASCNDISKTSSYTMTRNSFKTSIQEIYKTLMGLSDFTFEKHYLCLSGALFFVVASFTIVAKQFL